jgi:hypothetical protein
MAAGCTDPCSTWGYDISNPFVTQSLHVCVEAIFQGKMVQQYSTLWMGGGGGKKVILFVNVVVHYPTQMFSQQESWHHCKARQQAWIYLAFICTVHVHMLTHG